MTLKTLFAALGLAGLGLAMGCPTPPAAAQERPPALDYESLMDSDIDTATGLLTLGTHALANPPAGKVVAQVGVVDGGGRLIGHFPAYEDEAARRDGFTRLRVREPAHSQLGKPGVYSIVFQLDGEPITRFAFGLKDLGPTIGSLDPRDRYVIDGPWRSLAHITERDVEGSLVPVLTLWLGRRDLAVGGGEEGLFMASLRRNGQVVAQSKRDTGLFFDTPYKRRETVFFHPHQLREADSARLFTMADLAVDGDYEVRVTRVPDRTSLRRFRFKVVGGEIQQHPRARPGYEPAMDFILPWVMRDGPGGERPVEATWIGTK